MTLKNLSIIHIFILFVLALNIIILVYLCWSIYYRDCYDHKRPTQTIDTQETFVMTVLVLGKFQIVIFI